MCFGGERREERVEGRERGKLKKECHVLPFLLLLFFSSSSLLPSLLLSKESEKVARGTWDEVTTAIGLSTTAAAADGGPY
jgi:hypothetical protein